MWVSVSLNGIRLYDYVYDRRGLLKEASGKMNKYKITLRGGEVLEWVERSPFDSTSINGGALSLGRAVNHVGYGHLDQVIYKAWGVGMWESIEFIEGDDEWE